MRDMRKYKYMVLRRSSQVSLLFLFIAGNILGWNALRGNLSASIILGKIPLTDPFALLQIFATGNMISAEALEGALIVTVLFGLVCGRAFCSWVCPLNMVTDLANRLREKMKLDAENRNPFLSRKARYWVIGISLVLSFATGVAAFEWISPISMFHRGVIFGMGVGWTAVLAIFLFDLLIARNGFCGHLCPLGGFYSLITRFSLVRVRHYKEKCTQCMKCTDICPERQALPMVGKTSSMVVSGECTNCARCIEVCDDDAMRFGIRYVS
ncbi:MAG: quinol dehydrogenase ferredoxin subunit NapH [Nitrospirae bacterium]|nr:quinol dehydrogenase ferredoxin subunit NapH [Nitrospirota bacterium]